MLGLRDYVNKNRFPGVLLGLSGGIDSALTAAVAVDALGPERVLGVRLPSRFTSDESQTDADVSARARSACGSKPFRSAAWSRPSKQALAPLFAGRPRDITEENMQARVRGLLLMAVSNKFGSMLLTTGNKSEMSVGYATLYGDMCGGYSVLKDLYKTEVYALAAWRNRCLPDGRAGPGGRGDPAERDDQGADGGTAAQPEGSGLAARVRGARRDARTGWSSRSAASTTSRADGHPRDVVSRTQNMLFTAEYKRRQAPPGVKTSSRSFGRDRRYPITNRFRDR